MLASATQALSRSLEYVYYGACIKHIFLFTITGARRTRGSDQARGSKNMCDEHTRVFTENNTSTQIRTSCVTTALSKSFYCRKIGLGAYITRWEKKIREEKEDEENKEKTKKPTGPSHRHVLGYVHIVEAEIPLHARLCTRSFSRSKTPPHLSCTHVINIILH